MNPSKQTSASRSLLGISVIIFVLTGIKPAFAIDRNTQAIAYQSWINNFYFTDSYGGAFIKLQGSPNTWGFWQAAEEIEVVEDAVEAGLDTPDRVTALCNHYVHDFGSDWSWDTNNDDLGWAAMAFERAYALTGNPQWQTLAQKGAELAWQRGWDQVNGGMWQNTNPRTTQDPTHPNSQSSSANNPNGEANFMLYQSLADQKYLIRAQAEYNWLKKNCFNPATGEVAASPGSGANASYDQGGFASLCWNFGDFANAKLCGDYVKNTWGTGLQGSGPGGDSGGFNGICLRGLVRSGYDIGFLQSVCDQAWGCRTTQNLTSNSFTGPTQPIPLYAWDCSSSVVAYLDVPVVSTLPSGSYQLKCVQSSLLVSVTGGNTSPGAPVQQFSSDGTQDQVWTFIPISGGYYQIQNQNSLLDLAVSGTSTAAGAQIVQEPFGTQGNDQWTAVSNTDGSYSFFNLNSGLPLNDPGASTAAGTQFSQSVANGSTAQKFNLLPVVAPRAYYLQCQASNLMVEVDGGSTNAGAAVVQNQQDGTSAEVWTLIPTSGGNYQVCNAKTGLDLAVINSSTTAKALIVQEPFGTLGNDQWTPLLNGNNTYSFINVHSGLALNDPGASTAVGTQFTQTGTNGTNAQNFNLIPYITPIIGAHYHLRCETSNLEVQVSGSSMLSGAAIQQYGYRNTTAQSWMFIPTGGGYYQIQNVNSGLDLAVVNSSTSAGAQIVQASFGSLGNDQWFLANNSDGSYSFLNRNSGLPLDDTRDSTSAGNPFQQGKSNSQGSQKFYLIPDSVIAPTPSFITAPAYHMQCEASNLFVEVAGESYSAGAVAQQNLDDGTIEQAWTFIPTTGGYYQICNLHSGFDLAVSRTSTAAGAQIVQEPFGTQGNDQWTAVSNTDGSYSFFNLNSGLPLNDPGASRAAGTQFTQSTANGSAAQKFYLTPYTPLTSSTYQLQSNASNLYVGVAGGSTTAGAAVQQNSSDGTSDQEWVFIPTSSGYYLIQNVASGLYLAVSGTSTAAGAQVVQEPLGSAEIQWSIVNNPDGSYSFFNANSGLSLNDPGASTASGTQLTQSVSNGTHAQEFFMPAVGEESYRSQKILSEMTLDEKIAQMHGTSNSTLSRVIVGLPALGIPDLNITNGSAGMGPAGPGHEGNATALPAPISLASTWDLAAAQEYGVISGSEAVDYGNTLIEAPTVDIARVPMNGRTFEAYGEDPFLVSQLAVANIEGIQSQGIIADVKHFACYNQETNRTTYNAVVDDRTLREIYLPPFEAAVKNAHVGSVMAAYNQVNGSYCCENAELLNQILKTEWSFNGFVTSDFGAVHSTVPSVMNGLDVEMPSGVWFASPLEAAVESGTVSESVVDEHLSRRFQTMMQFGVWDNLPAQKPIATAPDGLLARQLAEEGVVLLRNQNGLLPLNAKSLTSVALIGPLATAAVTGGGGSSKVTPLYTVAPLDGLQNRLGSGVTVTLNDGSNVASAVALAQSSDVAIVMVGKVEEEGLDYSLSLPSGEDNLVAAIAAANAHTIVVLKTGGPILMPWQQSVPAIIEAWYPGEEDGNVVAAILFGDYNPSGKLPITFPKAATDIPTNTPAQYPGTGTTGSTVVQYSEGLNVGYRWYDAEGIVPLYPFGYGLSYTTFNFANLTLSSQTASAAAPTLTVGFDVTNSGASSGAEVAQVYVAFPSSSSLQEPPRQLKGFTRLELAPGKSGHAQIVLDARAFSSWNINTNAWEAVPGVYTIYVGDSSRNFLLTGSVTLQ